MNTKNIEIHVRKILEAIGENPDREGLRNTPQRVAESFKELLSGYSEDPKNVITVFNQQYDEMVIVNDVDFYSLCEHHLLPFWGMAHVGYLPDGKIVGLSKIPRIVDIFARRLQVQERLTQEIADTLMELLAPKGVGVVLKAEHLCMKCRGVKKQNAKAITSAFRGEFKENSKTRNEFLQLITS